MIYGLVLQFLHYAFMLQTKCCIWCLFLFVYFSSATTGVKRRGGAGGLNKVCGVSPELQAIVGEPALPRTEV